jgi:CHASE3 domain sensor protein
MREPLGSNAFRRALWLASLLTVSVAGAALLAQRSADGEVKATLARLAAARELAVEIERLSAELTAADTARRAFLLTWNSTLLREARAADERTVAHYHVVAEHFRDRAAPPPELTELGAQLSVRAETTARSVEQVRAGQMSRLRAWIERQPAEFEADGPLQLLGAIRQAEAARGRELRRELDARVARAGRMQTVSVVATLVLSAGIIWLVWQYHRLRGLVILCAWTRTVQFEGRWLTFEEYLERRFGLKTSHGMRPDQAEKFRAALDELDAGESGRPPA